MLHTVRGRIPFPLFFFRNKFWKSNKNCIIYIPDYSFFYSLYFGINGGFMQKKLYKTENNIKIPGKLE